MNFPVAQASRLRRIKVRSAHPTRLTGGGPKVENLCHQRGRARRPAPAPKVVAQAFQPVQCAPGRQHGGRDARPTDFSGFMGGEKAS
jgi:hypothetical protein